MNFSQNFKKPFLAVCSVAVLSTSVAYAAVCNEGVEGAIGKVHKLFNEASISNPDPQNGGCRVYYEPRDCQKGQLNYSHVIDKTITFPFMSFGEQYWSKTSKKELTYFNGMVHSNGSNADLAIQYLGRMNPVGYTFDLNQLSGKSKKFGSASWESGFYIALSALFNTGKEMAINVVFDNVKSYCSDAGGGECKLNVYIPRMYVYDHAKYDGKDKNYMCYSGGIEGAKSSATLQVSLEPTTQTDACNHQPSDKATINSHYKLYELKFDPNSNQSSYALRLTSDRDNTLVLPRELVTDANSECKYKLKDDPDEPPVVDDNKTYTFDFNHQIIERRSANSILGLPTAKDNLPNPCAVAKFSTTIESITLKDGNDKPAEWSSQLAWLYPRLANGSSVAISVINDLGNNCNSDVITVGGTFDGKGTWDLTKDKEIQNLPKALSGRDVTDLNAFAYGVPSDSYVKDLGDKLIKNWQKFNKCRVNGNATPHSDAFWSVNGNTCSDKPVLFYTLYGFKVKNVPGTNYENMKLTVVYNDGVTRKKYVSTFTARPDRIIVNDVNLRLGLSNDQYQYDCGPDEDCFNKNGAYPIAGLGYAINKARNTGKYQRSHPLSLARNFMAVDANGRLVDTYTKEIDATIKSASNSVVVNGAVQNIGIPEVPAKAVFKGGIGYLETSSGEFVYPYASHTFVKIIDNSLKGKCVSNQFFNVSAYLAPGFYAGRVEDAGMVNSSRIGCDTVLLHKPILKKNGKNVNLNTAKTIYANDGYNFNKWNGGMWGYSVNNDFQSSNSQASSGDYWYTFGPHSGAVSHTMSDFFENPSMTYYDDIADDKNTTSFDANGTISANKRSNFVYANLDLNITALNGDRSLARAYTAEEFEFISERPSGAYPNRNKKLPGLANDFNMTVLLQDTSNTNSMQLTLNTKDRNLFFVTPSDVFGNFGNDKNATFKILRKAFSLGSAVTRIGTNLDRNASNPKNPQQVRGQTFDLDFIEIVDGNSVANFPTNSEGRMIDVVNDTVIKSTPQGDATFFYGRLFVPDVEQSVKNTPYSFPVDSYYSVYCSLNNCQNIYPSVVSSSQPQRSAIGYWINAGYSGHHVSINGKHDFEKQIKAYLNIDGNVKFDNSSGLTIERQDMTYTKPIDEITKAGDVYFMKETPIFDSQTAVFLLSSDLASDAAGYVPYKITFTKDTPIDAIWHGAGSQGAVLGIDENKTTRSKGRMSR